MKFINFCLTRKKKFLGVSTYCADRRQPLLCKCANSYGSLYRSHAELVARTTAYKTGHDNLQWTLWEPPVEQSSSGYPKVPFESSCLHSGKIYSILINCLLSISSRPTSLKSEIIITNYAFLRNFKVSRYFEYRENNAKIPLSTCL